MRKSKDLDGTKLAYNQEGVVVHIDEDRVISGKNGYFCRGCKGEKIANKGEFRRFFSHSPNDVNYQKNCKFGDETIRHGIGKQILQRIKEIKVPPVYKEPPPGSNGVRNKLRDSRIIQAHRVGVEVFFYEDELGSIRFGKKQDVEDHPQRHLLIKTDVAFFDAENRPILLIELKATHKVTAEKIVKVRRLGIDMVEVKLPSDAPPDGKTFEQTIEATFYKTSQTTWIYNHEKEKTTYIFTAPRPNLQIPQLTEREAELLATGKSFECRKFEINELIREIRKHLGSEQYRQTEQYLRSEIQRVTENTERTGQRLRDLQDQHEISIQGEFAEEENSITEKESRIRTSKEELSDREEKIRKRFLARISRFREEERGVREEWEGKTRPLEAEIEELDQRIQSIVDQRDELGEDGEGLAATYRRRIRDIQEERKRTIADFDRRKGHIERDAERVAIEQRKAQEEIKLTSGKIERVEELRREMEEDEKGFRTSIQEQLDQNRRRIDQIIDTADIDGISATSGKLKALLAARAILSDLIDAHAYRERLRLAKRVYESDAYRDWV